MHWHTLAMQLAKFEFREHAHDINAHVSNCIGNTVQCIDTHVTWIDILCAQFIPFTCINAIWLFYSHKYTQNQVQFKGICRIASGMICMQ